MKFIFWLCDVSQRHYRGIRRYEKGGAGARVFAVLVSVLFIAATLGLEYWLFSSLKNEEAFGGGLQKFLVLLFLGILCVAFAGATLEYCAVYCFTAFRMAAWGVALSAAKRQEILQKKGAEATDADFYTDPVETGRYKAADICIGILQIAFIVLLIVGMIAVAALLL